jgi:DUF1365 family protein
VAVVTSGSWLVVGTVAHRRHRPRPNAFRYGVWHLLLDVDRLDAATDGVVGFGADRRGPVGIRRRDHFGDGDLPLRDKVARWVAGQGASLPGGPLLLLAHPRVLGHVFNPVSWWFAHHPDGRLAMVVAEVRNTFGDWRAYLLDDLRHDGQVVRATHDKELHVSPFLPIEGLAYRFAFRPPPTSGPGRVAVSMQVEDDRGVVLDATQSGRLVPLTTRSLWGAMLRLPLVTLRTVALIHWQALRLWWRRTPFHRRPEPPATGLAAVSPPDRAGDLSEPTASRPDRQEASA